MSNVVFCLLLQAVKTTFNTSRILLVMAFFEIFLFLAVNALFLFEIYIKVALICKGTCTFCTAATCPNQQKLFAVVFFIYNGEANFTRL